MPVLRPSVVAKRAAAPAAGDAGAAAPVVVFGAFDRHNVGDLLFPHLAQALLPGERLVFAGLASRDLRGFGGHRVLSLSEVAARWRDAPLRVLQLGGELLDCSDWHAAVMLLPPDQAQPTVAWLERRAAVRRRWVRAFLGRDDLAPYLLARDSLPHVERLVVAGVGGVGVARRSPALRAEVLAKLRDADAVAVRDRRTQAWLQAHGVAAPLLPDPAVMVAELFGARLRRRARRGEPAAVRRRFAQGYLALQCSAEFADDATLDTLAAQLRHVAAATGLGVVLWRAGAAPWHDDASLLQRLAARLRDVPVHVFGSLHLWDLCTIVAHASACAGSSLHGRIVALAFARPHVGIEPPQHASGKHAAYAATWEPRHWPGCVVVDALADALLRALAVDGAALDAAAAGLAQRFRDGFAPLRRALLPPS